MYTCSIHCYSLQFSSKSSGNDSGIHRPMSVLFHLELRWRNNRRISWGISNYQSYAFSGLLHLSQLQAINSLSECGLISPRGLCSQDVGVVVVDVGVLRWQGCFLRSVRRASSHCSSSPLLTCWGQYLSIKERSTVKEALARQVLHCSTRSPTDHLPTARVVMLACVRWIKYIRTDT